MTRIFASPEHISNGTVRLSDENLAHLRVLRIRPDERFCVCDGNGTDYICRLLDGAAEIIKSYPSTGEPEIEYTAYIALAKGDRLETAVQKSVELGACKIVLFSSDRCVAVPDKRALEKKTERLGRIALEAAKQSGRGRIPGVTALGGFSEAVCAAKNAELTLFCYELEDSLNLKTALESSGGSFKTAAVITGPEGGFTPQEAEYASSQGLCTVSLGSRILRCETAPLFVLSAVMFYTGNM